MSFLAFSWLTGTAWTIWVPLVMGGGLATFSVWEIEFYLAQRYKDGRGLHLGGRQMDRSMLTKRGQLEWSLLTLLDTPVKTPLSYATSSSARTPCSPSRGLSTLCGTLHSQSKGPKQTKATLKDPLERTSGRSMSRTCPT